MFLITSQKIENAKYACERKEQGLFAEDALAKQHLEQKSLDLMTADHKVFNEEGESGNNHGFVVVVQDLATQWIQSYPCKTKTVQETEKSLRKFLEPSEKPKVIYTDNHWNLANPLMTYHGTTVRLHSVDLRRMVLPEEWYAEKRRDISCNQAWMKNGGLIPWNAIATCKMFKTSQQMGKLLVKGDSENHFKAL